MDEWLDLAADIGRAAVRLAVVCALGIFGLGVLVGWALP